MVRVGDTCRLWWVVRVGDICRLGWVVRVGGKGGW